MTDLLSIPYMDDYETTLSQAWNGIATTIYVNDIPTATTPAGSNYSYIVVDPGKSNMQVRKVTAWSAWTLTVTTDAIAKGSWTNYATSNHASGATVRFSNNYQFRADIQTAINSKLDKVWNWTITWDVTITWTTKLWDRTISADDMAATWTTLSIAQTWSNFRIRKDWNDMKFRDDNTAETSLATIVTWAGTDIFVKVSATDTTSWLLNTKLTAGDGLSKTITSPAGDERLDLDIDLTDTAIFTTTQAAGKVPVLDWNWTINNLISDSFWDSSDWDVTITTTVTMTRDMHYKNLTINSPGILIPDWYRIFVSWTLSWDWKIQRNWNNGWNAVNATAWAKAILLNQWTLNAEVEAGAWHSWWPTSWWWGGAGNPGADANPSYTNINWAWTWWTATRWVLYNRGSVKNKYNLIWPASFPIHTKQYQWSWGASWGLWWSGWGWYLGWGWGGWGWGGGLIRAAIHTINRTGTWEAIGGNGWNWAASWPNNASWDWWTGGNGWTLVILYRTLTSIWTKTLTGGNGWAAGYSWPPGAGNPWVSNPWVNWNTWVSIEIAI